MTVKELIEKLGEFDENSVVVVSDDYSGGFTGPYDDGDRIREEVLYWNNHWTYNADKKIMGPNSVPIRCVIII